MGTSQGYLSNNQNVIEAIMLYEGQGMESLSRSLAIFLSNIKICGRVIRADYDREIWVTEDIIDLFLHVRFAQKSTYFMELLVKEFQGFLSRKVKIMMGKKIWNFYYYLSEFLMLCFDAKILGYVNENHERFNLITCVDEKILQREQQESEGIEGGGIEVKFVGDCKDRMQGLQRINQVFFEFMCYCIDLKNGAVSRFSDFAIVNAIIYNVLALCSKISVLFCKNLENKIKVITYCLGFGVESSNSSMINMCLKLIQILILKNLKQFKQIQCKPIPSHYFQSLPVVCCKNIYENIATYCVYIYGFKSQGVNMKLLRGVFLLILKEFKPNNRQILYYLDMISGVQELTVKKREGVYELLKGYMSNGGAITEKIKKFMQEYRRDCFEVLGREQVKEMKKKDLVISNFEDKRELQLYYHKMCVYKLMGTQLDSSGQSQKKRVVKEFKIVEKLQKQKQNECSTLFQMKEKK